MKRANNVHFLPGEVIFNIIHTPNLYQFTWIEVFKGKIVNFN